MAHDQKEKRFEAMTDEMKSKLPKGKRAQKKKWVFKLITKEHCSQPRYKARLVEGLQSEKRVLILRRFFHH